MKHAILIVDDEVNVLKSVRRQIMSEPYDVHLATSGAEGLELLGKQDVCLIISDMRMPEMDGVTFLRKAAEVNPHSIRMVLSGYAEVGSILEAVNKGHVWRYITKPWQPEDLKLAIKNGLDLWESEAERRRLTEDLKVKNAQLANVNAILEEKVKARTWELRARSEILQMILDDTSLDEVLAQGLEVIGKMPGTGKVALSVSFEKLTAGAEPTPAMAAAAEQCRQKGEAVKQSGVLALALAKAGTHLGEVVIEIPGGEPGAEVLSFWETTASLLSMALSQHKIMQESPGLVGDIDRLLGEIS
jgi:CheY-like chemotaxis protein